MAEQREQRQPDPRREVPQQVGGPQDLQEPALADAVGARRAKILLVLLVHDQERADIAEPVLLEPLEEELRHITARGRRQQREASAAPTHATKLAVSAPTLMASSYGSSAAYDPYSNVRRYVRPQQRTVSPGFTSSGSVMTSSQAGQL